MASNPIKINTLTLCTALAIVIAAELAIGWALQRSTLSLYEKVGVLRLIQTGAMLWIVIRLEGDLDAIGWAPGTWINGLKKGVIWSLGFATVAALGMALVYGLGHNPLTLIRSSLPSRRADLLVLFIVGGLIGPIAEEICFRGVLYTYFRRWGIFAALVSSTAIFVILHANRIPVTQLVGGIVFALAYETSRNLMTPITIHVLGNLVLFTLSLPVFQG